MNFILLSLFSTLGAFDARIKDFEKEIEEAKTYLNEEIELKNNATEWQRKLVNLFSPDQLKENVTSETALFGELMLIFGNK